MAGVRNRRLLIVVALLVALGGVCAPGGRTLAAGIGRWLAHLNPTPVASQTPVSPIPFILDNPARKHTQSPSAKPHRGTAHSTLKKADTTPPPSAGKPEVAVPVSH